MAKKPVMRQLPSYWAPFHGGDRIRSMKLIPACRRSALHEITDALVKYPEDFNIHPKVQKLLEQRREMGYGKRPVDSAWPKRWPSARWRRKACRFA